MPIGGIVSAIINAADPGRSGKHYLKEGKELWEKLQLPEYRDLIAPFLQQVGQLTPETYDPQIQGQFRGIEEDPTAQLAQLRNLGRLEDIAQEGLPLQDRLMAQEAQRGLASEGARAREAVLQAMRRRGRAGSGDELAAQLATAGAQEEAARGRGSDLAQMAIQNRLAAIGQLDPALAGYRGQNIGKEAQISEMQNRYNEFLSNLATQAAANAAQTRNAARQYNLGERQRIADTNVGAQYQNLLNQNLQQQQAFQDRFAKTQGITGTLGGLANLQNALQTQKQERVAQAGKGFDSVVGSVGGGLLGGGV